MRTVVGGREDAKASSASEMARFETETLVAKKNLKQLSDVLGRWIDPADRDRTLTNLTLDMDSSVSDISGDQEAATHNSHFECGCGQAVFVFNQFGDLEREMLRRGNHASAKSWRRVLLPVIERDRGRDIPKFLRGDSVSSRTVVAGFVLRNSFQKTICGIALNGCFLVLCRVVEMIHEVEVWNRHKACG